MRVLVIGAGRMGALRVEDLSADPRVEEVLVTNRTSDRADLLAAQFGARTVPWDRATDDLADAIVVAVGTDAHEGLLEPLLRHRRPLLCEKPIALTLARTQRIIDHADALGVPLQVGFQRRFDPALRDMHEAITQGTVGTLYSLRMMAHDHAPSPREFIAGSGGIFRDMHVHDFDLIRWLTGSEVAQVFATQAVRHHLDYADFGDGDVTAIHAVTADGVQVVVTGTRHDALGQDVRVEAFGSADSVSAGLNQRTPLRVLEGDLPLGDHPYTGFVDRFRAAFRGETAAFVSMARGEIENPCPPTAALESLRIAIACEFSVASGGPVAVADVREP